MTTEHPLKLRVATASPEDRPILERLWLMFRHDMSKYSGVLPNRDGGFRQERLDAALRGDVGWGAFLFQFGESPIGLAVVRALADSPHVISSFFLVHGARRRGLGTAAVQGIVEEFPGRWSVAFQDANAPAAAFWQKVASAMDGTWVKEHRGVPGRPDLRPDTWVTFNVR